MLIFIVICGIVGIKNKGDICRCFLLPRARPFFICIKESQMKTPQFLRRLLSSPAYMDKNSDAYAVAERYLRLLYPGVLAHDELDAALEESISEVESEYEEAGQEINVEDYVELEETIDVRVLMPLGATIGL